MTDYDNFANNLFTLLQKDSRVGEVTLRRDYRRDESLVYPDNIPTDCRYFVDFNVTEYGKNRPSSIDLKPVYNHYCNTPNHTMAEAVKEAQDLLLLEYESADKEMNYSRSRNLAAPEIER